jgi:hypothetical protein
VLLVIEWSRVETELPSERETDDGARKDAGHEVTDGQCDDDDEVGRQEDCETQDIRNGVLIGNSVFLDAYSEESGVERTAGFRKRSRSIQCPRTNLERC